MNVGEAVVAKKSFPIGKEISDREIFALAGRKIFLARRKKK